jgi:hypothetical protein
MPISEFNEFFIFDKLEPFGERRADLLIGILSSVIANCNRSEKQSPYPPEQFMPKWDAEPEQPQTAEQQKAILMMFKEVMDERMKQGG